MAKISAVAIVLNEEKDLPRLLKTLKWVDEVVVVDGGSTDKTAEVAKRTGTKVYQRTFNNFASQKNFALSQAANDWVLAVEADEEIPPELAAEVREVIKNKEYVAYLVPRRNIIFGKEIKHSNWAPDVHIWLFRRLAGQWQGAVHEEFVVKKGRVGRLKNAKIHYNYDSVSEFLAKANRYSELEAKSLAASGVRFSFFRLFWNPAFDFCRRFFYKLGFLDGLHGLFLSLLQAIYLISVQVKLWEISPRRGL